MSAADLHQVAYAQMASGFHSDLTIRSYDVQRLAQRLRGIQSITSVLLTDNGDDLRLSEFIRMGLIEAVRVMADDSEEDLERLNDLAAASAVEEVAE